MKPAFALTPEAERLLARSEAAHAPDQVRRCDGCGKPTSPLTRVWIGKYCCCPMCVEISKGLILKGGVV